MAGQPIRFLLMKTIFVSVPENTSVKEINNQLKLDAICAAFKEGDLSFEEFKLKLSFFFDKLTSEEVKLLILK